MSADAAVVAQRIARRGPLESVYGFGTIFAKGLRDSRRAVLFVGIGVGLIIFVTAATVASQFPTAAERASLVALSTDLPAAILALLGDPINVARLGGFLSWRSLNFMPIIVGLWCVLALSGTLASEASRGSLDVLATTGISRGRLAAEKALAHVAGLALAMLMAAILTWLAGLAFATLPGDEIPLGDALGHVLWIGLVSLVGGAIAFGVAPIVGRSLAAGLGAGALIAAFLINNYGALIPALDSLKPISWFAWTARHRPLAGVSDWPSVVPVAVLDLIFVVIGIVAFIRRDVGAAVSLPSLDLGGGRLGVRGPAWRSFVDRLPAAIAWALFIGLWGFILGASASAFAQAFTKIPGIERMIHQLFPGVDIHTAGGMLQLTFFNYGVMLSGLAAAVLVNGWTSDERDRRLDSILSAPLSRIRWVISGGIGLMTALAWMAVLIGLLVAAGAAVEGDSLVQPFLGVLVIGLYAGALAGIGIAIGGLFGPGLAAGVTGGLAIGFLIYDVLVSALRLPDAVQQLTLTSHLGQPMVGIYDPVGMAACAVIAVGGVLLGAWGLQRRDVRSG